MTGTAIDESMQKERSGYRQVWVKAEGTAIQRVVASATGCKITSTAKGT